MYILVHYADFGKDGSHHNPVGIYSTKEKVLEAMNVIHKHHDLTEWGVLDYRVYEIELDALPDNDPWFTGASYTELVLSLDKPDRYNNKVVFCD